MTPGRAGWYVNIYVVGALRFEKLMYRGVELLDSAPPIGWMNFTERRACLQTSVQASTDYFYAFWIGDHTAEVLADTHGTWLSPRDKASAYAKQVEVRSWVAPSSVLINR